MNNLYDLESPISQRLIYFTFKLIAFFILFSGGFFVIGSILMGNLLTLFFFGLLTYFSLAITKV